MASDQNFVAYVCEQLGGVSGLSHKKMFGEYAIYVGQKVVALVCDNQLFVKNTDEGRAMLEKPVLGAPYPGARPALVIGAEIDDSELLEALVVLTAQHLPVAKPKKPKQSKVQKKASKKR
jgi:TfoX/Sxy family transcriptional regulator of competence genes